MMADLAALIVDEGNWLPLSMGVAGLAVAILLHRYRHPDLPARRRIMAAMNLFFGLTMATMAFGHLLAVTTRLGMGTLTGSPALLYVIGAVLTVPSWYLVRHSWRLFASHDDEGRTTLVLNAGLGLTLLALGLHNLPLAAPAVLNIAYHLHSRRAAGWALLSMAVAVNLSLFVGGLIFMASGQSFEQFTGAE